MSNLSVCFLFAWAFVSCLRRATSYIIVSTEMGWEINDIRFTECCSKMHKACVWFLASYKSDLAAHACNSGTQVEARGSKSSKWSSTTQNMILAWAT